MKKDQDGRKIASGPGTTDGPGTKDGRWAKDGFVPIIEARTDEHGNRKEGIPVPAAGGGGGGDAEIPIRPTSLRGYSKIPTDNPDEPMWVPPSIAERIRVGEKVRVGDVEVSEARTNLVRPRILFKIPSRSRPAILDATLATWRERQTTEQVDYLLSIDEDDPAAPEYRRLFESIAVIAEGVSPNKIHAVNRDVNEWPGPWDIMVNGSDDMECIEQGWDATIIADMTANFPALDGALHYPDGNRRDLITLSIMGRRLYDAFGYIYHPSYASLWADNEFTDTVRFLNKYTFIDRQLFKHRHRSVGGGIANDPLYERNERFFNQDQQRYLARKKVDFDIHRVAVNLG